MESIEVADQGHVPTFDSTVISRIAQFVAKCDAPDARAQGEPLTSPRRQRQ
jgi:hypothetical protein